MAVKTKNSFPEMGALLLTEFQTSFGYYQFFYEFSFSVLGSNSIFSWLYLLSLFWSVATAPIFSGFL